jgi:hypothetical protein
MRHRGKTRYSQTGNRRKIVRCMHTACWKNNATNTHSEYVILTAHPRENGYAKEPQRYVYTLLPTSKEFPLSRQDFPVIWTLPHPHFVRLFSKFRSLIGGMRFNNATVQSFRNLQLCEATKYTSKSAVLR